MSTNQLQSDYLFFWGEKHTNGYLSNFYKSEFEFDGTKYVCSEQFFMKKKQELFDPANLDLCRMILEETEPKKIKQFGRMVNNFDGKVWDLHKCQIMYQGVRAKFFSNPFLAKKLVDTKDKILVEASPYDKIWGIGLSEADAQKTPAEHWPGQNLLGQVLMQVRKELVG